MVQWYWVILLAIGLTLWSVFCVLIGTVIGTNAVRKPEDTKKPSNPKLN